MSMSALNHRLRASAVLRGACRTPLHPLRVLLARPKRSMLMSVSKRPTDPAPAFEAAVQRMATLLTDASLGNKDTVPIDHLDACSAEERLTVMTNLGSLAMLVSIAVCWLFGEDDPLGGIRLDGDTLDAALAGCIYAMPLLLCSLAGRTRLFKDSFPVLEQLHEMQQGLLKHFTAGMNLPQVGILLWFFVLPALMLFLPTTTAGIAWLGAFMQQVLLQPWGDVVHIGLKHHGLAGQLGQVLPPVLSGYMAGLCAACCFSPRPKEVELVREGFINADKFFSVAAAAQGQLPTPASRVAPAGPASVLAASSVALDEPSHLSAQECDEEEEQQQAACGSGKAAADAFKTVAMVWFLSQRRVARLAYVLSALDIAYLGVVWQATSNLATPAVAAFLLAAAECLLGEQQEQERNANKVRLPVLVKAQDKRR